MNDPLPHSYQLVVTPSKHQVHGLGDPTRTKRPRCRKEWQAYGRVTISMCRLNPWKDRKMSSNFKHYHCHVLSKDVFCLEVIFFCQFSTQNQSKFQKYCFFIGWHSNLDWFLRADMTKKMTSLQNTSLGSKGYLKRHLEVNPWRQI